MRPATSRYIVGPLKFDPACRKKLTGAMGPQLPALDALLKAFRVTAAALQSTADTAHDSAPVDCYPDRMSPATWRTRHRLLRAAQVVVALVAVLVVVAAALHLPVVRRALLRAAVGQLERRFDIVLRAESLGYNLATLRVDLAGVTVAAAHDPGTPFLHARRVDLALPWGAVLGGLAFDEIRFDEARVTVVQRRDGTANLPRSRNGAGGWRSRRDRHRPADHSPARCVHLE